MESALKMNICFASLSYPGPGETSGVASQVHLLTRALTARGNTVAVIALASDRKATLYKDQGAQIHSVVPGALHWFVGKLPILGRFLVLPLREIEYSLTLWRCVRRAHRTCKFDLIEGTETAMLLVALFMKQVPLIIRLHGEQYTFLKYTPGSHPGPGLRLTRSLQRIALRRARLLISPSEAHAREIKEELGNHPPIVVVPNGIVTSAVPHDSMIKRSAETVLYVGRLERVKGIPILLEAAAQVKQMLPGTRFVMAGGFHSSCSKSSFDSLVQKLGLENDVKLLGTVDWNSLSEWYQRATISVLPSYYETFGLAALEPMTFGTPVLATNAGGLPEIVNDRVTGKLVPPGDSTALAAGMIDLLCDAASRERMGNEAMRRAAQFCIDRVFPMNDKLFRWTYNTVSGIAGPHVFFSPHADDVVLSCGGTIDALRSGGRKVHVVSVFAGQPETSALTAFSRHLHAKWRLSTNAIAERRREDEEAMNKLGVDEFEQWSYPEAPYRRDRNGEPLYCANEELKGQLPPADRNLREQIAEKIRLYVAGLPHETVLYFPLSLGGHVDHRILFDIGRELSGSGRDVTFYEDYPYATSYRMNGHDSNWLPKIETIILSPKVRAASAYVSQIHGLGGSSAELGKRLLAHGKSVGDGIPGERYWKLLTPSVESEQPIEIRHPLVAKQTEPSLRDFVKFLRTFRWHDLDEVLPVGDGACIDLGCGSGRHRERIQECGYHWVGLDRQTRLPGSLYADATSLPIASGTSAVVVAWQVLEYIEKPDELFAEAARVLEPGGVFCGSVSFLEPVHGRTYFNLSPLILERLLTRHNFADIEIKPGLNGFVLTLWTWLRRSGIPLAEYLAIPAAFATFVPLAALIYCLSWLGRRLGFGSGHLMRWLSQAAPLEFAGHVMFSARKRGSAGKCT